MQKVKSLMGNLIRHIGFEILNVGRVTCGCDGKADWMIQLSFFFVDETISEFFQY